MRRLLCLAAAGTVMEVIWIAACSLGPLRESTPRFLVLMFLAFILCLWVFFYCPVRKRSAIALVLGFSMLFRLTVLFAPPSQSEDVYRYIWDAKMSSIGINPYSFPPDAPELENHRDDLIYPMINSKPYVTAYPPLSQMLFRFSYEIFGTSIIAMKAVFSLFEFLAVLMAWKILMLWGRSLQPLILMAWNPFFIFEFSHSGHSDSAMMFFIMLSVYLLIRKKNTLAMISYAGAVMVKLHPALWFPLFLRRVGWKPAIAAVGTGLVLSIIYFTFDLGLRYVSSLTLYFKLFEFNASVHYLLRFIGHDVFQQSWNKETGPYLGFLLLIITVIIVWKFPLRDERDLLHAGFWIMTANCCLATTVHPWYICWAALAIPFFPYAFMVYWTGACFLSYIAYTYDPVYEPTWALLAQYLPLYALMAWEIRKRGPLLKKYGGGSPGTISDSA